MRSQLLLSAIILCLPATLFAAKPEKAAAPAEPGATQASYRSTLLGSQPVLYWGFDSDQPARPLAPEVELSSKVVGSINLKAKGPRPDAYPLFGGSNNAASSGGSGRVEVTDPGENSLLDFKQGDSITLEAWVKPATLNHNQQVYIVGKGRTQNPGVASENQNYALRLRGDQGVARASFLFRSAGSKDKPGEFHRWNTNEAIELDGRWHHIAISFTFGNAKSIKGYVDGKPTAGKWDMGGDHNAAPVVDNDEVWLGSAMGGSRNSSFSGAMDEVAIYRSILPAATLKARFKTTLKPVGELTAAEIKKLDEETPRGYIHTEVFENLPAKETWQFPLAEPATVYKKQTLAFTTTPEKYTRHGIRTARSNVYMVRARLRRELPAGEYEVLLRSRNAARLYVDGKLVAQNGWMSRNGSGHEKVPELAKPRSENLLPLAAGHQEKFAALESQGGEHVFRLEAIAGGKGVRSELGQPQVAISDSEGNFYLLTAGDQPLKPLTAEGWQKFRKQQRIALRELNQQSRQQASEAYTAYWQKRHEIARQTIAALPPLKIPGKEDDTQNPIDRFLQAAHAKEKITPAPVASDMTFLRRVTLDVTGVIPTREEIAAFNKLPAATRRQVTIDRLLASPRRADHWTSYWQDVLGENPGILKPTLNNTGPFRWWIHESMYDNKPLDRFVSELTLIEGSKYTGGTAGFGMATQNDVPMAAKAHTLSQAFLGIEMKCARCHDAPFHPHLQRELFSVAAMLKQAPIKLPGSSSVPIPKTGRKPAVEITIKPGESIKPDWPFASLTEPDLPQGMLQEGASDREKLAALVTSPTNMRFAKVMVNRIWARLMGNGLVDPVDDWHDADIAHPQLLEYLARQFAASGYDMKHIEQMILSSDAYQREVRQTLPSDRQHFAAAVRRRMSAEQIVDSMFVAAGKDFHSEELTLDPEGRRPVTTFINLGRPSRAWQFTGLSNERDRPALALPVAQSFVDVLLAFGWRDSRPAPQTRRDETVTVMQPLTLANGVATGRITRLSDDHALTELCLQQQPAGELVEQVFLQFLSRRPTSQEKADMVAAISPGYEDRIVPGAKKQPLKAKRNAVSWSNHLNAEATRIKLELEEAARAGDPPTRRLTTPWRERMEDVIWAMVNSPEFIFVP